MRDQSAPYEKQALSLALPEAAGAEGVVGWQGILDLHNCRTDLIDDIDWVRGVVLVATIRAGATSVANHFHRFSPYGISGVVIISESHLAIHIWPERSFVAVDIFTCNSKLKMRDAADYLIEVFQSARPKFAVIERGGPRNFATDI